MNSLIAVDLVKELDAPPAVTDEAWTRGWPQTAREFEALVEAFQDRLVRFAFRRLGHRQDAEDAIQQVLVNVFLHRIKYRDVPHVTAFLYRMAANACVDAARKRGRRAEVSLEAIASREPVDGIPSAASETAAREEFRRIETWLAVLPRRQAEVIRCRVFDELSFADIARIIGRSEATVKSRFRYGLLKLKKKILSEGEVAK
ncbi:MAG: RNA polymerase sigma factor [bacterium]